ncbi:MAG TPA: hypothetical protein VE664_01345 [Actinomycetes bacterium]|nr:hypothetical protein [Actinomycetes bacterium]
MAAEATYALQREIELLATRARIELVPAAAEPVSAASGAEPLGLTNRQIGEALFISPKTASVHVPAACESWTSPTASRRPPWPSA